MSQWCPQCKRIPYGECDNSCPVFGKSYDELAETVLKMTQRKLYARQRTKEGIETARLEGKQIGQKRGAKLKTKVGQQTMEDIQRYSKDFDGTMPDAELIKKIGVARNTFYKYKRILRSEVDRSPV